MDVQGHSCDGAWLSIFNLKQALMGTALERVHQTGFDWGERCEVNTTEMPLEAWGRVIFPDGFKDCPLQQNRLNRLIHSLGWEHHGQGLCFAVH